MYRIIDDLRWETKDDDGDDRYVVELFEPVTAPLDMTVNVDGSIQYTSGKGG